MNTCSKCGIAIPESQGLCGPCHERSLKVQLDRRAETFSGGQSCPEDEVNSWTYRSSTTGGGGKKYQSGGGRRIVRKSEPNAG